MRNSVRRSPFFKTISIFLAFIFSSYNLGFSTIDGNAAATEVVPSYAGKDLSGIAGVPMSGSRAFQFRDENLSPLLTFGFGIKLIFDEDGKKYLEELSVSMKSGPAAARGFHDRVNDCYTTAVQKTTKLWLESALKKLRMERPTEADEIWNDFVTSDHLWEMLRAMYLGKVRDGLGDVFKGKAAVVDRIYESMESLVVDGFNGFRTASPGFEHAATGMDESLTEDAKEIVEDTIKDTIKELKKGIARELKIEEEDQIERVFQERYGTPVASTGGSFVSLPEAIYKKHLKKHFILRVERSGYSAQLKEALHVVCHPGTRGTRKDITFKDGKTYGYEKVTRNYYIIDTVFDSLTDAERVTFAKHEEMHIMIALRVISPDIPEGMTEEEWVNGKDGCDIRPAMSRLGLLPGILPSVPESLTEDIARLEDIDGILGEIAKERSEPGSGELPGIKVISDTHGEIDLFLKYIADAVSEQTGKIVSLDHKIFPQTSINEQLLAQGVDITQTDITFHILGDFADRGAYGIKCFRAAEELIELGVAGDGVVMGNHDHWMYLNAMGFHLPTYKGYNYYGHTESEELVEEHWDDREIAEDRIGWWTEKLAEYNEAQQELQKTGLEIGGEERSFKEIREGFKAIYLRIKDQLTPEEKKLWEDLIGYYFCTVDVYTGFNAVGMMSARWWEDKDSEVDKFLREAIAGGRGHEIEIWETLKGYTAGAAKVVRTRLESAKQSGEWWWRVFNDINHQNYSSVEWWAKEWSSHKGWGTSVIAELNELEGKEIWSQKNYIHNKHIKEFAAFCRRNFTLYLKDRYGSHYTHGWLPVDVKTGQVRFTYKDVTYEGEAIWKGLDAVQSDVRDMDKPLSELYEAFSLVNSWYADKTTRIKPEHVAAYVHDVGLEKIHSNIGIRAWFTCHNPLNKLHPHGIDFKVQKDGYLHFSVDKGMSYRKFKDVGGYAVVDADGIRLRGYSGPDFREVIDNPSTMKLGKSEDGTYMVEESWPNEPLEKEDFLAIMKAQLEEERDRLEMPLEKVFEEYRAVTAEEFAARFNIDLKEAQAILERLWLKSDNIEKTKASSGKINYSYNPVGLAVQIGPDTRPEDVRGAAAVVIGHSETTEFLGATDESVRDQMAEFLKAGFKVILAFGDFPVEYEGVDYLEKGFRKFPDTFEGIKAAGMDLVRMFAFTDTGSESALREQEQMDRQLFYELEKLYDDARLVQQSTYEQIRERFSGEFLSALGIERVDKDNLDDVKKHIIAELSTRAELKHQISIRYSGLTEEDVLHRVFLQAYEPVEGIKSTAISPALADMRYEYILDAIAETTGVDRAKLGILYGGGAKVANIGRVCEKYGGGFIGRASSKARAPEGEDSTANIAEGGAKLDKKVSILFNSKSMLTPGPNEYIDAYEEKGIDLAHGVKVVHVVSLLDLNAWQRALRGEDVRAFFADAREAGLPVDITIAAGATEGTQGIGAYTAHHPAELLAQAGVTRAVIDPSKDYAAAQVRNFVTAGITPVILSHHHGKTAVEKFLKELGTALADAVEIVEHDVAVTPVRKVREVLGAFSAGAPYDSGDTRSPGYEAIKNKYPVLDEIIPGLDSKVSYHYEEDGTMHGFRETMRIIDDMSPPQIIGDRAHRINVLDGSIGFGLIDQKEEAQLVADFGPDDGELLVSRGKITRVRDGKEFAFRQEEGSKVTYRLVRQSKHPAVVEVDYEKMDDEKVIYAAHKVFREYLPDIFENKIDLIFPREVFAEGSGEGSAVWLQRCLDKYLGKDVVQIMTYSALVGLDPGNVGTAVGNSIRRGRIPVLAVTEQNIEDAGKKGDRALMEIVQQSRILALPDLDGLNGKGWAFAAEAVKVALLQACLTADMISGKKDLAVEMQRLMAELRDEAVALDSLYLMLPFDEIPETYQPEGKPLTPSVWTVNLIKKLLLSMPIEPLSYLSEQLMERQKILWSV